MEAEPQGRFCKAMPLPLSLGAIIQYNLYKSIFRKEIRDFAGLSFEHQRIGEENEERTSNVS